ncbi:type III PLP-dependent enzyme [Nonomuraea deserti]|uniref:Type III PLP-dependent enzyme n=1 Tax=Nonomuraea deserti TaxID=1848322 RepID=A0A4R4VY82_9ACTN|nr:type III PLP-dependent enzyme [Nonomuraea deserti]TDD11072.1 type III PLP-dependent enzyme [Nonomuraea deserti]
MTAYTVQGLDIGELAEHFGTPLYVYDGDALRQQFEDLRARLHSRLEIFFSLKSNPNVSICTVLGSLGARAEVSSLAELATALRAGIASDDILFLGPGKSEQELRACLTERVHAIVCESFGELELIDRLAAEYGVRAPVVLRVNPGFAVKGSKLTMGGKPRQFGIDEDQLLGAPDLCERHANVRVAGIQTYMGTRILSEDVVAENTRMILDLAERLSAKLGFPLDLVDVGGGLGVAYFDGERDLDVDVLAGLLNPMIEEFTARNPATRMVMELGRYLTAPSGIYVVRVRYVKTSMGERFAIADGGTNHHMAAVGIGSFVKRNFPVRLLSRSAEPTGPWTVTGPLCTPNDTLAKAVVLPDLRPGDLLGVLRSGAYGPSASPVLFLSHGHPAEVLVIDGESRLIRERDGVDDLLRQQRMPISGKEKHG